MIALPDGPDFVATLFGALKLGAVVVMVNPALPADEIAGLLEYTRARVLVTHRDTAAAFETAARSSPLLKSVVVAGTDAFEREWRAAPATLETFPSHPDDAAIWLFSGGTTGTAEGGDPDAPLVRQHHRVLRAARDRLPRRRHHAVGAEALLRLRDRIEPAVSVLGRRRRGAVPGDLHGGGAVRSHPEVPAHACSSTCPP